MSAPLHRHVGGQQWGVGAGGEGPPPAARRPSLRLGGLSRPLSDSQDGDVLSEMYCLIRSQIEVFTATEEDVKNRLRRGGAADNIEVGAVGIRCSSCAAAAKKAAEAAASVAGGRSEASKPGRAMGKHTRGATCYPKSIRLVYQSVRNWRRHHMGNCPNMLDAVKEQYAELKSVKQKRSVIDHLAYWEETLRSMGMVDAKDGGIRLRDGVFEEGDEANEESSEEWSSERNEGVYRNGDSDQSDTNSARLAQPGSFFTGLDNSTGHAGTGLGISTGHASPAVSGAASALPETRTGAVDNSVGSRLNALSTDNLLVSDESLWHLTAQNDPFAENSRVDNVIPVAATESPARSVGESNPVTQSAADVSARIAAEMPMDNDSNRVVTNRNRRDNTVLQVAAAGGNSRTPCAAAIAAGMGLGIVEEAEFSASPLLSSFSSLPVCSAGNAIGAQEMLSRPVSAGSARTASDATLVFECDHWGEGSARRSSNQALASLEAAARAFNATAADAYGELDSKAEQVAVETRANASLQTAQTASMGAVGPAPGLTAKNVTVSVSPMLLYGGASLPKDVVLNRVKLARDVVEAAGQIRPLPIESGGDCLNSHQTMIQQDLRQLGTELYELFSGCHPFAGNGSGACLSPDGSCNSTRGTSNQDDIYISQQQKKRGRRRSSDEEQRRYVPLSELGLPKALCELVSSLLDAPACGGAVNDDDYDSAEEVGDDLRLMTACPDRFLFNFNINGGGEVPQLDFSGGELYGRSRETSQLLETFQGMQLRNSSETGAALAAGNRNDIFLVSGYSGTGKSALVRKVQAQYAQMGACCISGKFDAMQQTQPLSAVVYAMNEYCNQLANDERRIDKLREAVSTAMGGEGRVLAGLIPNLGRIIDVASPSTSVTSDFLLVPEAQHRLAFLIRMLFRSTCSRDHPVVLFLDDLQWADEASLRLMQTLVTDAQLNSLLLVGSYRDNEVGPDHPLMTHLNEIQQFSASIIPTICISNLDKDSVNGLLSDVLHLLPRKTRSLAEVVTQKTGGNALFVVELLDSLRNDGLLRFSLTTRRWDWDLPGIMSHEIADTVVQFVTAKLLRLGPEIHCALKVAAAFGAQVREEVIRVLDRDPDRLVGIGPALEVAVSEGLMAKVDGFAYRFSHDQIQNAAYLLLPESDREAFHLQIGRSLWRNATENEASNYLFIIVEQLHRGVGLITSSSEKLDLARLSLVAGERAIGMSSFLPALVFLKVGIDLVGCDWESNRCLFLRLVTLCAETESVLGDFVGMKRHVELVFQRALAIEDQLSAYSTLVQSMIAEGHANDAIDRGMIVLGHLGEDFPVSLSDAEVKEELMTTQKLLSTLTEEELLALPVMENVEKRHAMKMLNVITTPAAGERGKILPLLVCRMVQLSLSHGVCNESAVGFSFYGMIIGGQFADLAGGYRFGKLALSTVQRIQAKDVLARVHCLFFSFISNWIEPMQSSLPPLKEAIDVGLATGDTEYAMMSAHMFTGTAVCTGAPLGVLYEEMKMYAKQMKEYNRLYTWTYNMPIRQFVSNLLGRSVNPIRLVGEEMDEDNLLGNAEIVGNQQMVVCVSCVYRIWLEYLFGEYDLASETGKSIESQVKKFHGRFAVYCQHVFYFGLTALALARKEGSSKYVDVIDKTMGQMKTWADSTPWNCQHKMELMNAEYKYLTGDRRAAAEAYILAANLASKHRFIHEEALALERAGIFHLETGDQSTASAFFSRAHSCYLKWGACSKAAHVKEYYL